MPTQTAPSRSGSSISLRESIVQELAGLRPAQLRKVRDFVRFLKLSPLVRKLDPDQAYFWTPEWQAKEREVDEALKRGDFRTFDTMEEMIAFLDSQK